MTSKFKPAKTDLHDTIARFDFAHTMRPPSEHEVMLTGTRDTCREQYLLAEGLTRVGRANAEIALDVRELSRLHATIEVAGSRVVVTDEGSANGTFVNGVRIAQPAEVTDGDIIVFGQKLRFVLTIGGGAAASAQADEAEAEEVVDTAEVTQLRRERKQLAMLFQIALRYLEAGRDADPVEVLFSILPRVVAFQAALVAEDRQGELVFRAHPGGVQLSDRELKWVAKQCKGTSPVIVDEPGHEIALPAMHVESRALLPLGDGGWLVLLAGRGGQYALQLDFLSILCELHSSAAARSR